MRRYNDSFTLFNVLLKCFRSPVYKHLVLMRLAHESLSGKVSYLGKPFFFLCRILYKRSMFKTGIQISPYCNIGGGFNIEHSGTIVIGSTTIGKNFTIFHGVTVGYAGRPGKGGTPVFGDNVVIGANATIVGPIEVGNNVFIGANAYVCKDIPDNAVVGANPANIISYKGTKGYFGN